MAVPKGKLVTVDIGTSWTRVFIVDHDRGNKLKVGEVALLPTSMGDLTLSVNLLLKKLEIVPKENVLLFTSTMDEAQTIASDFKGIFVPTPEVRKNLLIWLKEQGYPNCKIFYAGSDLFTQNYKATEVGSYLTFGMSEVDLENYLANRALIPHALSETKRELEIEQAVIRVALKKLEENLSEASNVLLTDSLIANQPEMANLALMVLDVLSAHKVAEVLVDKYAFANSWGAALTKYRELLDFEIDFMEKLGSFVSLGGSGRVELDYGLKNGQEVNVGENEIALVPATEEQKLEISFPIQKEKRRVATGGGTYGVLIDARPKPLKLIFGQSSSQRAMMKWGEAIQKVELIR